MNELRLNKAIAMAGVCSRRKADELIQKGVVRVNGKVVTELGLRISQYSDEISVEGKKINLPAQMQEANVYIMLHKPIQVVSTAHDPEGRKTVLDILPAQMSKARVYPVGRLDYFSEGLLLLTNDGELTHRLTHPSYHIPKYYEVLVREEPTKEMLASMQKGMKLEDGTVLASVDAKVDEQNPRLLLLVLHQGINRQIRRMCQELGLTILTLRRVAIGEIHLGGLAKGSARNLTLPEVSWLKKQVGLD